MQGLMMQHELMISDLIEHAAKVHSNREIYTLNADMTEHRQWIEASDKGLYMSKANGRNQVTKYQPEVSG